MRILPNVERMYPFTVRLDEYDTRKVLALCRKHQLSEDELFRQLLDLAAALAFNDDELKEVHAGAYEY